MYFVCKIIYSTCHMFLSVYIIYSTCHMFLSVYIIYSTCHMFLSVYIIYSTCHMFLSVYIIYSSKADRLPLQNPIVNSQKRQRIPLTHIYMTTYLPDLAQILQLKVVYRVKLVLWTQTFPLSEMIRSYNCFSFMDFNLPS